jgi:hypothetical protein
MITSIPDNQICEAFDPMMILPEKTKDIIKNNKPNTSCFAPAYVYLEGSRGKRFLCDFHYHYEKDITIERTPEQWPLIAEYLVEKLENVKLTFGKNTTNRIKDTDLCYCNQQATILMINKYSKHHLYHCNFHFRKMYFRYLSNNVPYINDFIIIDERYKMDISIKEEMDQLPLV